MSVTYVFDQNGTFVVFWQDYENILWDHGNDPSWCSWIVPGTITA